MISYWNSIKVDGAGEAPLKKVKLSKEEKKAQKKEEKKKKKAEKVAEATTGGEDEVSVLLLREA